MSWREKMNVKNEHRQDRHRKSGQDRVPVGNELADEHLTAKGQGLGFFSRRQDQREPQIIPDRDHVEDCDRRHRRAHERQHKAEEDRVFREPVDTSGVLQIV